MTVRGTSAFWVSHVLKCIVFLATLTCLVSCSDGYVGPIPPSPVYPAHHLHPSCSISGLIAYEDRGIICESLSGGYQSSSEFAGIWVYDEGMETRFKILSNGVLPRWSPDGSRLAFVWGGHIYILEIASGEVTRLTDVGQNISPAWSPDGEFIAYESTLNNPGAGSLIWTMRVDGSNKQCICQQGIGECRMPDWSPIADKIVHIRYPEDGMGFSELFEMDSSGESIERLTFTSRVQEYLPRYSSDGSRILYTAHGTDAVVNVWEKRLDTFEEYPLTVGGGRHACYTPEGNIVYVKYDSSVLAEDNGVLWKAIYDPDEEEVLVEKWPEDCSNVR